MISLLLSIPSATIDIIALSLLGILALFGLIEGFTKTFFTFFGTIVAIFIAILLSTPVINWLQDAFGVLTTMSSNVSNIATDLFGKELMQTKLSVANEGLLNSAGISGLFISIILSIKGIDSVPESATVSDVVCPTFAYYIVLIITVVVLYILLKIIFSIISKIVKKAYISKSVAGVDRLLGLILGLLYGIIIIETIISIASVIPISFAQDLCTSIQTSSATKFIQDIDLIGFITKNIVDVNIVETITKMVIK